MITSFQILSNPFTYHHFIWCCIMFRVVFWDILPCKMIVDDSEHHTRRRENLKSDMVFYSFVMGWTTVVWFPLRARIFLLTILRSALQSIQSCVWHFRFSRRRAWSL
jgi:hypothetical protein